MCGRYNLVAPPQKVMIQFSLLLVPEYRIDYNINPGGNVLAVRNDNEAVLLHWGWIPFWAKEKKLNYAMINARSETLAEKPSFRDAFKKRHAIIPATGYYEWQQLPNQPKQPYLFSLPGNELFGFAALWEHWEGEGETIESCTIITTEANPRIAGIHNRMPVILNPQNYQHWLNTALSKEQMLEILKEDSIYSNIEATPVSHFVNNPRNNDPLCIKPIETE